MTDHNSTCRGHPKETSKKNILECHCEVCLQILFKDIDLSILFQPGCIRVTFISGNKNHQSNNFFSNVSSF